MALENCVITENDWQERYEIKQYMEDAFDEQYIDKIDELYLPYLDANGWLRTDSQSDSRDTTEAQDISRLSSDADAG